MVVIDKENPMKSKFQIGGGNNELAGPWGNVVDGAIDLWVGYFLGIGIINYKTSNDVSFNLKKRGI